MKKNLIIGVIKDYGWNDIEPFFVSWKKNCSNIDCVIFYNNISAWTIEQLKNINDKDSAIELIKIPEKFKDHLIIDLRWTLYINFLETHKAQYSQVLLTDVRDVIFQGNLFEHYEKYDKYLSYATEELKLTQPTNEIWIKKFFGAEVYEKIKHNNIICCGTICGTIDELLIFAHEIQKLLAGSKFWGAEQASVNYLIYNNLLPINNILESNVQNGMILTNGWRESDTEGNYILNYDKQVPAVVHQYDRHKNLCKLVDKVYRLNELDIKIEHYDLKSSLDMIQCTVYTGHFSFSLDKFMKLLDKYVERNQWKGTFNRLINMLNRLTSSDKTNLHMEFLEQAVCSAVILSLNSNKMPLDQIQKMYDLLLTMRKKQLTIYKPYERQVIDLILQLIEHFYNKGNFDRVLTLLDRLKKLNYKLTSDNYLMSAKVNRLLGNKNEALEDYKNALEMVE